MRLAVGQRDLRAERTAVMLKKDLGLFLLILVVGAVVAILNPRFLSPINLANTANLIGLFGLFSIGEGFVIITGGIDLSVGSMFALLGVIFIDLLVDLAAAVAARRARDRAAAASCWAAVHGLLITRLQPAAVHRHAVRPADLSRRRALLHQRRHRGLRVRPELPDARMADDRAARCGVPHTFIMFLIVAADHVGGAAPLGLRPLPVRRRQERGGGALSPASAPGRSSSRPTSSAAALAGVSVDLPRHVHALDLAGLARQFLRALRASPRRCSAAARCAAARARSSASCSAPSCCRCCRTWSTCSASRARSTSP